MCLFLAYALVLQDAALRAAAERWASDEPAGRDADWEALAGIPPARIRDLEALRDAEPRLRDWIELAACEARFRRDVPRIAPRGRRLSYTARERPASDVFSDLQRLLGAHVAFEDPDFESPPAFTVDVRQAAVPDLLAAVARSVDVGLRSSHGGILLGDEPAGGGATTAWGSWRFQWVGYSWRRAWSFRGPRKDEMRMELQSLWDPGERPIAMKPLVILRAVDAKGADLRLPPGPEAEPEEEVEVQDLLPPIELRPPSPGTRTLRVLRGFLPVFHARREAVVDLAEVKDGAQASGGGATLKVLSVDVEAQSAALLVAVPGLEPADLEKVQVHFLVELPEGRPGRVAVQRGAGSEQGLEVSVAWYAGREVRRPFVPTRVRMFVGLGRAERRIPFEFRDLELK